MRPDYLNFLFTTIDKIKDIGEKTLKNYSNLLIKKRRFLSFGKIPTMFDLLYHFPEKILNRKRIGCINGINAGDYIIAKVKIINHVPPATPKSPYKILCYLGENFVYIIYYKVFQKWLESKFPCDKDVIISGKVDIFDSQIQIIQPDYIDNYGNLKIPEFEPIYPLTYGITNKEIINNLNFVLQNIDDLREWLPEEIKKECNWDSWKNSLLSLHNPQNNFDVKNNKFLKRLVFDELLAYQLSLILFKEYNDKKNEKESLKNSDKKLKNYFIENKINFKLTNSQLSAINEIENDTFSSKKMNRLLQGDVGSGKTIVAFLSGLNYIDNNKQIVFMAPTSILATQHYENFLKLCEGENINVELLIGQTKLSKKKQILKNLEEGNTNILIGTHTLIEENVIFKDLGFVIIDEQQRFGVEQRLNLINKNKNTDILAMSATPIPRTMALTLYSDMDLTVIKEKPINRKDVKTSATSMDKYQDLLNKIKEKFNTDEKIFWVCPLVEESENIDLMNVKARYEEFCNIFGSEKVSFVYGKMKEKDEIMEDFIKNDEKKILISTTVIEIGIDVKQATIMVVEHPERFGLSQLHQLRGRVGRNDKESFCILLFDYKNIGERSLKRLKIMRETNDGFRIAEEDLKIRGIGEILGLKQSGGTDFFIADLDRDMDLLLKSNILARKIIENKEIKKYKDLLYLFNYINFLNREIVN